jgi:hypothetical protein
MERGRRIITVHLSSGPLFFDPFAILASASIEAMSECSSEEWIEASHHKNSIFITNEYSTVSLEYPVGPESL